MSHHYSGPHWGFPHGDARHVYYLIFVSIKRSRVSTWTWIAQSSPTYFQKVWEIR